MAKQLEGVFSLKKKKKEQCSGIDRNQSPLSFVLAAPSGCFEHGEQGGEETCKTLLFEVRPCSFSKQVFPEA